METNQELIVVYLLVEANTPRKIYKDSLEAAKLNYDLETFYFTELSELMESEPPDIIFMSCNLPCLKAKRCLNTIRRSKSFDNVPIIIFSNSAYLEEITSVYESKANLYVPKSVLVKERVKTIESIFQGNWRKDLLKPKKTKFVLSATFDDHYNLIRSAS